MRAAVHGGVSAAAILDKTIDVPMIQTAIKTVEAPTKMEYVMTMHSTALTHPARAFGEERHPRRAVIEGWRTHSVDSAECATCVMDLLTEQALNHFFPTESLLRHLCEWIRHQWRQLSWARRIAPDAPPEVAEARGLRVEARPPRFTGALPAELDMWARRLRCMATVPASQQWLPPRVGLCVSQFDTIRACMNGKIKAQTEINQSKEIVCPHPSLLRNLQCTNRAWFSDSCVLHRAPAEGGPQSRICDDFRSCSAHALRMDKSTHASRPMPCPALGGTFCSCPGVRSAWRHPVPLAAGEAMLLGAGASKADVPANHSTWLDEDRHHLVKTSAALAAG